MKLSCAVILCLFILSFDTTFSSIVGDQGQLEKHSSVNCVYNHDCYAAGAAASWADQIHSLPAREQFIRMYVLSEDDGSSPVISEDMTNKQISTLNSYMKSVGVSFVHESILVKNSSLRHRYALPFCDFSLVGNGVCDSYCNVSVTNYDGGDCFPEISNNTDCLPGVCSEVCNIAQFNWDSGECCKSDEVAEQHCRDPTSDLKVYYEPDRIKDLVSPLHENSWNIYTIQYANCSWCGAISTLPTAFDASDPHKQGTIYNSQLMVEGKDFAYLVGVHEAGHTFGLLHPFTYAEMGTNCEDPCFDGVQYPVDEMGTEDIGDLISDTRPMTITYDCSDPEGLDCAGQPWTDTPYRNIMTFGYLTAGCVSVDSAWTEMQRGRMRCFVESTYSNWTLFY